MWIMATKVMIYKMVYKVSPFIFHFSGANYEYRMMNYELSLVPLPTKQLQINTL